MESVVRQPHIIKLLFESEIKNILRNHKKIYLTTFSTTFNSIIKDCEKIFMLVIGSICDIEKEQSIKNGKNYLVSLREGEDKLVTKYELKSYINEFVFILIKDLLYKLNRRSKEVHDKFVFSDIILSDILFFQLMPRYPMFYLIKNKDKIPLIVAFFEKIIKIHWGYLSFLEPLIYYSHFAIKNSNQQTETVTYYLLNQIKAKTLEFLDDVKSELELNKFSMHIIMNIMVYLLNLLRADHIIQSDEEFFKKAL